MTACAHRCCDRTTNHDHFLDPDDCQQCARTECPACKEAREEGDKLLRILHGHDPLVISARRHEVQSFMHRMGLTSPCPKCGAIR